MRTRWKAAILAMGLAACGIQEPATSAASAAEVERLFDDGLEPPTVGITLGSYENRDDAALTARARLAEIIYRAQVTDILPIGADGVAGGWLIELTKKEVLSGGALVPESIEVEAPAGSTSASLVGNFRASFERAHLLVFARRYKGRNGRTQWHVHTVADTREVRSIVAQAGR